jgi:fluoride exporter
MFAPPLGERRPECVPLMSYLLVFLGGGIGATVRHGANVAFLRWFGNSFPYHTVFENISGSFAMGLLAGYLAFRGEASQHLRLFLTTGLLGGYTTFSAFSLDAMLLWERGALWSAIAYVLTSVACSVLGASFWSAT